MDKRRQLAFTRDEEKSKSFCFVAMAAVCALLFLVMTVPSALAQTPTPGPCAECKLPEEPATVDNLLGAGLVLLGVVLARKSRKTPNTPPSELDG